MLGGRFVVSHAVYVFSKVENDHVFRCVLTSLYEVMSVGQMDGWSVGPIVTRFFQAHFFL